ncbi:MAG: glycosyltransferase family 2 protein [Parabacteroides sp.]|nr:glycosyltransferase family 2 protein [Parabacteroides sp.]
MDVSIIYVNYKTAALVLDSIRTVKEKAEGVAYEIIVVDNCSADGSVEKIRNAYPDVRLIEAGGNIGFGRANNLGVGIARGTALLFLNPDTLLVNNAVGILFRYLAGDRKRGACGGNLTDAAGKPVNSFGRFFPSLYEEFLSVFYLERRPRRFPRSVHYNHTGRPLPVASVVGAGLMVKRSVLDETGPFSPDFFMNFEETELCFRIVRAGYAVANVPEARIIHLEGQSDYTGASQVQRYLEGQYVFFGKRYGNKGAKRLYRLLAFKCGFRACLACLFRNTRKSAYWQMKRETNKQAFNRYIAGK